MHTEKQIFYIWSSDSSEGGRERKDKMKKNNSEDSEIQKKELSEQGYRKGTDCIKKEKELHDPYKEHCADTL